MRTRFVLIYIVKLATSRIVVVAAEYAWGDHPPQPPQWFLFIWAVENAWGYHPLQPLFKLPVFYFFNAVHQKYVYAQFATDTT